MEIVGDIFNETRPYNKSLRPSVPGPVHGLHETFNDTHCALDRMGRTSGENY